MSTPHCIVWPNTKVREINLKPSSGSLQKCRGGLEGRGAHLREQRNQRLGVWELDEHSGLGGTDATLPSVSGNRISRSQGFSACLITLVSLSGTQHTASEETYPLRQPCRLCRLPVSLIAHFPP